MNRTAKRARRKVSDVEKELQSTIAARDSLLDVLNALLQTQGGRVVVPGELIDASRREHIHVTQKGDPPRYIIELESMVEAPETEPKRGIRERLRRIGLTPA